MVVWLGFGDPFVSQTPENFIHLILWDRPWCAYHLVVWSNFNHLDNSNCITTISSCLVLYFFWLLLFYSFESFSHQCDLMGFRWSLKDSKSRQVPRTLLCIPADLNYVVVWLIPIRPPHFQLLEFPFQAFEDSSKAGKL